MKIVSYTEQHKPQLLSWFKQWGWDESGIDLLPDIGLIVENTAAIFLYYTNSKVCFVEGFISNKDLDKQTRGEALDGLAAASIKQAKEAGFKYSIAYTSQSAVRERSKKFGYSVGGSYVSIIKKLEER